MIEKEMIEDFDRILLDIFQQMHQQFFGSRLIQSLSFEKSEIGIYSRPFKGKEINFFLFHGCIEDFLKATSSKDSLQDVIFHYKSGVVKKYKRIDLETLYTVPALLSDGTRMDYPCAYLYFLPTANAKNELLQFMMHKILRPDMSMAQMAEICAAMICAHEIRHEVRDFEKIALRRGFPEELSSVDMKEFLKFVAGMLEYHESKGRSLEWFKREKDACITQAYAADAWAVNISSSLDVKLQKLKRIVFS